MMQGTFKIASVGTELSGWYFSREALEQVVANQSMLRGQFGDKPDTLSHYATNFRLEGDDLVADIVVLDTNTGLQLQSLLEQELIGFGMTGHGKTIGGAVVEFEPIVINAIAIPKEPA